MKPSTAWRPQKLEAYEPTLAEAGRLAVDFVARAERHASEVRRVREAAGIGPVENVHAPDAKWLTFSGAFGSGKTRCLAEPIYRHLARISPFADGPWVTGSGSYRGDLRRPECVFLDVSAFIDRTLGGSYDYPEWLGRDWLVVVDDLGANRAGGETGKEMANDALLRLCNARMGKMTLFTTNWTVGEIAARIDGRVASRLVRDGNIFHRIAAGDYAMRKS